MVHASKPWSLLHTHVYINSIGVPALGDSMKLKSELSYWLSGSLFFLVCCSKDGVNQGIVVKN